MSRFGSDSWKRLALAAGAIGLSLLLAMPVSAQDATESGEVIPGSECMTPALPVTFLGELVATPASTEPYVMPTAAPTGETPDDETVAQIEATIRQFISCSNAGDVLRALALFDDDYLRRVVDPTGELDPATANELVESFATPIALTEDQLVVFLGIRTMVQLPDGKVAVVLETDGGQPNPEGTDEDLFIFERVGEQWIIVDAVNDIDDVAAQSTPEAGS
ncbi:MAG: hypothetical protein IT336_04780 [Thermomicrobiales bacterium]|nr:hypothetical protein [Thermomicrobiales bacterium]